MSYRDTKMPSKYQFFSKEEKVSEIKVLRENARKLRDEINKMVEKVWHIEDKLQATDKDDDLLKRKQLLQSDIEKQNIVLDDHLNRIIELEVDLYGHSDVGSNSPYVL